MAAKLCLTFGLVLECRGLLFFLLLLFLFLPSLSSFLPSVLPLPPRPLSVRDVQQVFVILVLIRESRGSQARTHACTHARTSACTHACTHTRTVQ